MKQDCTKEEIARACGVSVGDVEWNTPWRDSWTVSNFSNDLSSLVKIYGAIAYLGGSADVEIRWIECTIANLVLIINGIDKKVEEL